MSTARERWCILLQSQTMFDQAIIFNIILLLHDCCWLDSYNMMVKTYNMCHSTDEHPAQFWFNGLKTDQSLLLYAICIIRLSVVYELFGRSGIYWYTHIIVVYLWWNSSVSISRNSNSSSSSSSSSSSNNNNTIGWFQIVRLTRTLRSVWENLCQEYNIQQVSSVRVMVDISSFTGILVCICSSDCASFSGGSFRV